jgi:TonB family protein
MRAPGLRIFPICNRLALVMLVACVFTANVSSQTTDEKSEAEVAEKPVEVFQAPRPGKLALPKYPDSERGDGNDGWVNLNFMVDPQGKPYEVMVSRSSGNKALEKAAIDGAEAWKFEPASLNGKPIDSAYALKITFRLRDNGGARPNFLTAYHSLNKAVEANDKAAAESALASMHVTDLYEDSYLGLAKYEYASHWGGDDEQLAALRQAIADEKQPGFLPRDAFVSALVMQLRLQTKTKDFAGALATWETLKALHPDKKMVDGVESIVEKIEAFHASGGAYSVPGRLVDGSWSYSLFRKQFQIRVSDGHVSEIKLRCDKKYVFFAFDPGLQYRVADEAGHCWMQVIGDPETKFELVQF